MKGNIIIMKIIKKILLPLVLFLSLFFNTSSIFAANNLSTTFNANNDGLTVTVKNNSDKELSDVEYNLNLPSEYTAKYEVNPNYSLSPQEETTFKVKVSKSGDNVSNNGEKETKTFTSSKKSLDNTGLTSELTVGAIVVLFLLVGVLLYFKQRKVFIILLVAGIGTQLFPRYSFASDKIRQTENFKEHVTLLENNIPVSLDVSYLIEDDSNNNGNNSGNNGNTSNNNGNNSGNNGLNPNDKDPKEVLVAGYAYSGKTTNVLEEKELKVFDGDKEIAIVKTDAEGYFFTHLIQDKTYTIKGEDFEVTVTAKNTGDYEHKDVVGKLTLGRELKDENTYIKVKPSVAYINEDIEYKVEGDKVTIEGERELKTGDKLILAPNHTYLTGFAFTVNTVSVTDGKTVLTVTPITILHTIVDDFKYNEEIDINSMKFIPAEGVKVRENVSPNNMDRSFEEKLINREYELGIDDLGLSGKINLSGKMKYDISLKEYKFIVEPNIKAEIEGKLKIVGFEKPIEKPIEELISDDKDKDKGKGNNKVKEKLLGILGYINAAGVSAPIKLYAYVGVSGEMTLKLKIDSSINMRIGYENNSWVNEYKNDYKIESSLNIEGFVEIGPKVSLPGTTLFGTVKVLQIDTIGGMKIEGNLKGVLKNTENKWEISGEGVLYPFARMKVEIDFLRNINLKPYISKEISGPKFSISTSKEGDIPEPIYPYKKVFDDFKKIREYKDDLQKLYTTVKLNEYWNSWVLEAVAESEEVSYTLYDINNDGVDELLISKNKGDYLISSFYLDNGNPRLLVEDYVAKHGGWRAASNIYVDGSIMHRTWSSGTGKGNAELFKLTNGKLIKIKSLPIDNILTFDPKNMDVSSKKELNLSSLQWKPIK